MQTGVKGRGILIAANSGESIESLNWSVKGQNRRSVTPLTIERVLYMLTDMAKAMTVTAAALKAYRAAKFRLKKGLQLRSADDAVRYVDERGFVYFWPIKGVDLPNLWTAVAGNRPVADAHDDPGHITWGWKDGLLGARRWYYGKLLRGKATMVSLDVLPFFYALSENYGDPDDYLMEYEAGRLTVEAKQVFETLAAKGALDSLALRREARLLGKESNTRFERALVDLQRGLRILPIGVAKAGAWKYAFIYELVDRWLPDVVTQARAIGRGEARARLTDLFLQSVGAAPESSIGKLFGWPAADVSKAVGRLADTHRAQKLNGAGGVAGEQWVTAQLT